MNLTLPNFLIENPKLYEISYDDRFVCAKSNIYKKGKLYIRNTMHMIILIEEGDKIFHLDDKDIKINKNQIVLLTQGNYFMSEIVSKNNKYQTILLCFDDKFIIEFIKKYSLNMYLSEKNNLVIMKSDTFLNSLTSTISSLFELNLSNKLEILKLKTEELFLYLVSKNEEIFISYLNSILSTSSSRTKYILESNIDIIKNLNDMCSITRLSENSLRKEIQNLYNTTPKKWLDSTRLQKASKLLKNTSYSVSYIATSCGYSNVSWFIKQFKEYYNTTPFLFRKEN